MSTVKNLKVVVLSNFWATLKKVSFDYTTSKGAKKHLNYEVYDRGDGVAALLYNLEKQSVLLTRQFRIPTYLKGHKDGMILEVCAGMLDNEDPDTAVKREIEEEMGYRVKQVNKVLEAYVSPGADTERLHLYTAQFTEAMKVNEGGGLETENEDILIEEYAFAKAYDMIHTGEIIDAKTIMLLQFAKLEGLLR